MFHGGSSRAAFCLLPACCSLQEGDYAQLAHLFPVENLDLEFKRCRLTGVQGWDRVGMELALFWANDIAYAHACRFAVPRRDFLIV